MPRPNFFIIGAPRCGTTALWEYLRGHPNVFFCDPKEPHFFATDFPTHRYVNNERDYLRLFDKAGDGHLVIGESSSWYLYSKEAAANIRTFDPDARIIAMVRNPVDMIPALHGLHMRDLAEDETDLERVWSLREERRDPRNVPKLSNRRYHPSTYLYDEVGKLGEQVERLLDVFPREQVKVIVFDDLIRDTRAVYEDVLSFLNLPPDGREEFPPVNVRRSYRSRRLARLTWHFGDAGSRMKSRLGIVKTFNVFPLLNRFNWQLEARPVLRPEFRVQLVQEFRPDVERLASIIGRDLSHWTSDEGPSS
jgi:hypothetical protein